MISILDKTNQIVFNFPKPIKLKKEFIDFLEDEDYVDNKYYINTVKANELIQTIITNNNIFYKKRIAVDLSINNPQIKKIANCITAHLAKDGNWIERRKSKNNGVIVSEK